MTSTHGLWLLLLTVSIGVICPAAALGASHGSPSELTLTDLDHTAFAGKARAVADVPPSVRVQRAPSRALWFGFLCAAIAVALLTGLYLLRVKHVQARYRQTLKTRHRERERVARDIHDTLLQGIQAVLLRLRDWETDSALPAALREEVAGVVTQAAAIVVEGRERIVSLRGKAFAPEELINHLTSIGQDESRRNGAAFQLRVNGRQRSLTMDANQQLLDIGREAIRNAYLHSEANRVTVVIEYRWRSLRLEVRDNGRGIDFEHTESNKGRHFGLLGMRERADDLHGKFSITRLAEGGTAVVVVVPAGTAYSGGFNWVSNRRTADCSSLS